MIKGQLKLIKGEVNHIIVKMESKYKAVIRIERREEEEEEEEEEEGRREKAIKSNMVPTLRRQLFFYF